MKQNSKLLDGAQVFIIFALLLLIGLQMSNVVEYGEITTLFHILLLVNIVLWGIKIITLKRNDEGNKKIKAVVLRNLIWLIIGLTVIALRVLAASLYYGN